MQNIFVGNKIKWLSDKYSARYTKNKTYQIFKVEHVENDILYWVKNDNKTAQFFRQSKIIELNDVFIILNDERKRKLKKLNEKSNMRQI